MTSGWHDLLDSGDDFLATAPFRYVNSVDVPATPERTWAATSTGSRLTWTPALEPRPALEPLLRLTGPITSRMIRGVARGLRSQVG